MLINDINTIIKEHFNRTTLIFWVVRKSVLSRTGFNLLPIPTGRPLTELKKWVFTDVFNIIGSSIHQKTAYGCLLSSTPKRHLIKFSMDF